MKKKKSVIIIGSGVAGSSCAIELAKNNFDVTVIESRGFSGGRISSYIDQTTNDEIDNGQHLMIGAYHNFLYVLKELGSLKFAKFQKIFNIGYLEKNRKPYTLSSSSIYANKFLRQLGLLSALLSFQGISAKSKLNAIIFVIKIKLNLLEYKKKNTLELLQEYSQSEDIIKRFWEPMILATLNTKIDEASAELFIEVLKKGFFANGNNSQLVFPSTGLKNLLINLEKYLHDKNCKILFNQTAKEFLIENGQCMGIKTVKGDVFNTDYVISAIPPNKLNSLLGKENVIQYEFEYLEKIQFSSIISIYLWFDKEIITNEITALIGTKLHWIFNRNKILDSLKTETNSNNFLTATISCADDLIQLSNNEILKICLDEIYELVPEAKEAKLLHHKILKEAKATMKATPDINSLRPNYETKLKNFFVICDWTNTGLPATIESASQSGIELARTLINQL